MIKMSPKSSLEDSNKEIHSVDEWVEIVEPKSKQKIYANLETGICAKYPPEGAVVSRTEDFSDHWWELYDEKTGKYYYYNPEQQKTAWTKPCEQTSNTNGNSAKRLLIIPVSRLQTFKRLTSSDHIVEKRDASTQTIASNLVSTGTQTVENEPTRTVEDELKVKLKLSDSSDSTSSSKPTSCVHPSSTPKYHLNHRQMSDFTFRDRPNYLKKINRNADGSHSSINRSQDSSTLSGQNNKSSHLGPVSKEHDIDKNESGHTSYFGPTSSNLRGYTSLDTKSPPKHYQTQRTDEHSSSTSTFGNASKPPINPAAKDVQKMTTNNLSHYLVREARAMGIALISDDELDDDQDSDEDCIADDDEDTDLRDDTSSHDAACDLNASQDLGEELGENSSEGWKSFSDQESPNSTTHKSQQSLKKSPIHCETPASFTFNELIDDEKNPAACLSQQLDHRKLVENFKKSRQTSSFGLHDSLGRSYKIEANNAVQRIKTVADSYFNHDKEPPTEKHLRQLSTLSTLPRPRRETKDRIAMSKREETDENTDADYDVVEENCGYYSDSEQLQSANQSGICSEVAGGGKTAKKTNLSSDQQSPNSHFDRNKSSRGSTFSVESFARENLTRHAKKGGLLFNRKVKWSTMITWTKSSIKQPMISSVSSDLYSDSIASFKLIQQFMGDRKVSLTKKYRQVIAQAADSSEDHRDSSGGKGKSSLGNISHNSGSNIPHIPDRLRDELAYELVVRGCSKAPLRDEIYIQMARQLTENPSQESVSWGLILMSILLSYFSPSSKFSPFLLSFFESHSHQMARDVCLPRLEKRLRQNWLTYCRKPADGKEIAIVRLSITKWPQYCGIFGESLERIMSLQACSPYLKTLRLPWILTTLGEKLIETGGTETEGIFRCAADHDLIAQLRLEIDCVDFRKITDAKQVHSFLSNVQDPHVIAGLLKLFFRQLYEPVFPSHLYETCLQSGQDGHASCCRLFNDRLPNLNKDVVAYLIRLLQLLAQPDKVTSTKMDNSNLSMVWAPNLLRIPHQVVDATYNNHHQHEGSSKSGSKWSIANGNGDDHHSQIAAAIQPQSIIFEQTRQEMQFIRSLIIHLDTSFIENIT